MKPKEIQKERLYLKTDFCKDDELYQRNIREIDIWSMDPGERG